MIDTELVLISIVGPTAVGKTSLAIHLAKRLNTQILSCDSRQFFQELTIGTAPPSVKDQREIKHHLVQHKSIHEPYSVGDFEREAIEVLGNLFKNYRVVIMVGGSGLYEKAITQGLDNFPMVDEEVRIQLNKSFEEKGLIFLQKELEVHDPTYYQEVDKQNPMRLIRALEVCIATGRPYSSFRKNRYKPRAFQLLRIGLTMERTLLYKQIDRRVDKMLAMGLMEEARSMYPHKHLNALQTVGYKEFFDYFDGKSSLEKTTEEIKKNSRRYAKRQLTWFKKIAAINWFEPTQIQAIEEAVDQELANLKARQ